MIKVVSFKICPFVHRVTAMLDAKSVKYEVEYIQLSNKPQWFLDISPIGQVPVLITPSGTALFESEAIIEYIDETTPPLQSGLTPEERAVQRAWSYQASKQYLVQCSAMQSAERRILDERISKLGQSFDRFEKAFNGEKYFSGGTIGNVDIALLPLLHRAALVEDHSGYDMLIGRPRLKALQSTLSATGLAERSAPSDFSEKFAEFYFSERTWLGHGGKDAEAPERTAEAAAGSCCG